MDEILEKVQHVLEKIDFRGEHYVVLPLKGSETVFREHDIFYIEREKRVTRICQVDTEEYTTLKLTEVEGYLNAYKFVRCHNSFIVNLDRVHVFNRSEFILENKEVVPISRSRYEGVKLRFEKWRNFSKS